MFLLFIALQQTTPKLSRVQPQPLYCARRLLGSEIPTAHNGNGSPLSHTVWGVAFGQTGMWLVATIIWRLLHTHFGCLGWADLKDGLGKDCQPECLHMAARMALPAVWRPLNQAEAAWPFRPGLGRQWHYIHCTLLLKWSQAHPHFRNTFQVELTRLSDGLNTENEGRDCRNITKATYCCMT